MRRFALLIALLAGLGGMTIGVTVGATTIAPSANPSARVAQERAALVRARAQAAEAGEQAERLMARANAANDEAERERVALAAFGLRVQAAEARVAEARSQLALAQTAEARQLALLAERQRPMMALMARLQMLTRRPPVSLFAQPGSARDIVHSRIVMESVLPRVRRETALVRRELAAVRVLRQSRQQAVAQLETLTGRLAGERAELARRSARSRGTAAALSGTAGLEADRALALAQDAADVGALVERLSDAASTGERLSRLDGPFPRPGTVVDRNRRAIVADAPERPAYRFPAVGVVETGLGEEDGDGTRSRGLTLRVASGAQLVAPADGRVVYAGPFRSFGRIVIIDHSHGWSSLVTNLSAVSVRVGDRLVQGAPIGRAGPGRPRVTVELRRNGRPMDIAAMVL